ncbi:MAG: hypothetical protein U9P44_03435 [archaeon]|nr:hypothetical protein [archaeon]
MQRQKLDFETYPHHLLVEVKFNGGGMGQETQLKIFLEDFKKKNKDNAGYADATLHKMLVCASGKDYYCITLFDIRVYFMDCIENMNKFVINGIDYSSVFRKIKNIYNDDTDQILHDSEIYKLSKDFEHITKDVIAEIREEDGLKAEMSEIIMNYSIDGDIFTPEIDIVVGFASENAFNTFYRLLESKNYLIVERR